MSTANDTVVFDIALQDEIRLARASRMLAHQERVEFEAEKAGPKFRGMVNGDESWDTAGRLFPVSSFPWNVLPVDIGDSLRTLAHSCAISPTSLPGAAIAIFASTLGSTIHISPKERWNEPLIFWFVDIRPSGEGKTHAPRMLCEPIYAAQKAAEARFEKEMAEWNESPDNSGTAPQKPKGYFITDLTLEGLRQDLSEGHGGTIVLMDEISSFITSQNQYKGGSRGNDRETWLALHDGKPARIVRANGTTSLSGACVSLFGGIQPAVWHRIFGGNSSLYISDGTIYRFLPTYEEERVFKLDEDAWREESSKKWEYALHRSITWAQERSAEKGREQTTLPLCREALIDFLGWRNRFFKARADMPAVVKGFFPKTVTYSLRLAGILHCMRRFSAGYPPGDKISVDDVRNGITLATFYLGHSVNAIRLLCRDKYEPLAQPPSEKELLLAQTLDSLRNQVDSGRLAIGHIQEIHNGRLQGEHQKVSARAVGEILRNNGLSISSTRSNANGKRGAYCVTWDARTEKFIERCSDHSGRSKSHA